MKQFINFFIKQSFDHYVKHQDKKIFMKKCLLWLRNLMESWQEKNTFEAHKKETFQVSTWK